MIISILALGMVLHLASFQTSAQVKNKGIPNIINYSKKVYSGGTQSWSIAQDKRGFLYFGNNDGLLEFDGSRWRKYFLPNRYLYRAVAVANDGTVYVGLSNDFGCMKPDETGMLVYESISQKFPETAVRFNDIWKIIETSEGIYFQSKNKIFIYKKNKLEVIHPKKEFNFLFKAGNLLYTSERELGLLLVNGNQTIRPPGGDFFIGKSIESVLYYDNHHVIVGTAKSGLYLYDGKSVVPWAKDASGFLKENAFFCGIQITNRYFAFGSIRNGVIIVDRKGKLIQHLNQSKGLQNNTVLSLFADMDNNLWLGLDRGISFVETNSPISFYNYGADLPGTGYTSINTNGNIYAGTNQGLFFKRWMDYENPLGENTGFQMVQGTQGQVWSLKNFNNLLLCGHNSGTYLIEQDQARLISDIPGGWDYYQPSGNQQYLLGGTFTGINLFAFENNEWRFKQTLSGFTESSRLFTEDDDGALWIAHGGLGIFRVVPENNYTTITGVRLYTELEGLPSRFRNSVFKIDNQILFTTIKGVYRFNRESDRFEPDQNLSRLIGNEPVNTLFEDKEGNIWFFKPSEIGVIRSVGGEANMVEMTPFLPLKNLTNRSYEHVNVIDEHNIIIACEEGFAHYDPTFPIKYPDNGQCFIRSVIGYGDSAKLFYGGIFTDGNGHPIPIQAPDKVIRIPFSHNTLRFEFAMPSYGNPGEISFTYWLEGLDEPRNIWYSESSKEYTRLKEGYYTFHVKGKNIYNFETPESLITLRILPPFYRSITSYILYLSIILLVIWVLVKWIIRKIQKDKNNLVKKKEQDFNLIRQKYITDSLESEKKMVLLEKEKLETDMAHKNKQLAASISGLVQKNEFLIRLKDSLTSLADIAPNSTSEDRIKKIIGLVNDNIEADMEDQQFEDHFDAVHDNFLKNLKKQFPQLTPRDLRLCAYLRMNLTTKEIAPLLNISPRGVEISRYRLRKKIDLDHNVNLNDFMLQV